MERIRLSSAAMTFSSDQRCQISEAAQVLSAMVMSQLSLYLGNGKHSGNILLHLLPVLFQEVESLLCLHIRFLMKAEHLYSEPEKLVNSFLFQTGTAA